ncbi:thermonuclease family protein [Adhaeribacter radiodurans]|uniref:Thermonuclease family protein n=1 Tax=Adhaeribacter radiodurans TaxID=2745197 RepID=A0A7L7L353_9BACT|nr:thermonuclease family protein [Adhaeribacter radiodurans]QMU27232.1 thermonuclease family protein [Adhaeribacter radiodurans]
MRPRSFHPTIIYLLFWCLLWSCRQHQTETVAEKSTSSATGYKVIAIKDGDTIELLKDGKPVRVRLLGVDAPEKNQDYGTIARQFTSDLCFGKMVNLVVDGNDRYGRTVGTIILPDGRTLNNELVRNGYAWHYKAYSRDKTLAQLEIEARQNHRGLWEKRNPVAPWEFRKSRRTSNNSDKTVAQNIPRPSDAARKVYICASEGATTYHLSKTCSVLKRCKAGIETVTRGTAVMNRQRTACKICAKPA